MYLVLCCALKCSSWHSGINTVDVIHTKINLEFYTDFSILFFMHGQLAWGNKENSGVQCGNKCKYTESFLHHPPVLTVLSFRCPPAFLLVSFLYQEFTDYCMHLFGKIISCVETGCRKNLETMICFLHTSQLMFHALFIALFNF